MFLNTATERSLDLIARRAGDVYHAFTPGAVPAFDDVATKAPQSRPMLDPLAVTAPGDDYFITGDDAGKRAYTRDGRMRMTNGTLVGADGRAILGYSGKTDALGPMKIDSVDDALGRVNNVRIEANGEVAYDRRVVEPRSGVVEVQRVSIGRIVLARFPAATKLTSAMDGSVTAPAGIVPHVGRASDGNFGSLSAMRREESRIDFERSLDRLHDAYVAFDALQAAHKAQGATGKVAMDLLK